MREVGSIQKAKFGEDQSFCYTHYFYINFSICNIFYTGIFFILIIFILVLFVYLPTHFILPILYTLLFHFLTHGPYFVYTTKNIVFSNCNHKKLLNFVKNMCIKNEYKKYTSIKNVV